MLDAQRLSSVSARANHRRIESAPYPDSHITKAEACAQPADDADSTDTAQHRLTLKLPHLISGREFATPITVTDREGVFVEMNEAREQATTPVRRSQCLHVEDRIAEKCDRPAG
jgi:hypothetical protein